MKFDNISSINWTNQEHGLSIIQKLLFEITRYDGVIKLEHSISGDLGLESLDWIEFFIKLQKYTKENLSNNQLNKIFQATVETSEYNNSDIEFSLLSRLKVAHVLIFLEHQLHRPLKNEEFTYSDWKEKFFPSEQSTQPTFQTWTHLATNKKGCNYLKKKKIESGSRELEILKFFWLKDELGILVIEDALNGASNKMSEIDYLNTALSKLLSDQNTLNELRLELAMKCITHADNTLRRIENTGDDWRWIIEDFISENFTTHNFQRYIKFSSFKSPQNKNEFEKRFKIIKQEIINFISEKLVQMLTIWTSKTYQNESLPETVSLIERCQSYLKQHYNNLIDEFWQIFPEQALLNTKFQLNSEEKDHPLAYAVKSSRSGQELRFSKIAAVLDEKSNSQIDFDNELNYLKQKWKSPLNFLIHHPDLGSVKERISLLTTIQTDWETFLEKNINKHSEKLKIIFFNCMFQKNGWDKFSFENYFLKVVLNWQDLRLKLKQQDNQKLICRIEEVWTGIELNIAEHNFSALEIFMRFGLRIFDHDSSNKLFQWLSNPKDKDLSYLLEADEIKLLNKFL